MSLSGQMCLRSRRDGMPSVSKWQARMRGEGSQETKASSVSLAHLALVCDNHFMTMRLYIRTHEDLQEKCMQQDREIMKLLQKIEQMELDEKVRQWITESNKEQDRPQCSGQHYRSVGMFFRPARFVVPHVSPRTVACPIHLSSRG